ncbi:2-keto-4-pentenoate hydratase [Nocardioides sp. J54]|uniref:2-keto-4-pentenoate hydratase n=1 Tax=Nocardioides sp. J54 TaxID=935866 RepID=UPI0004AE52EB|nr:fumarylacetoacetate hydrolase family protein [Nocardioides sp. J54]
MPQYVPTDADVEAAADRLIEAAATRAACAPVRDLIGRDDVGAAYAVQRLVNERRIENGAVVTGRKIGLTSRAVQEQLGVDRPDFGVLFADMNYADASVLPLDHVIAPRVEAEVAFVLAHDLTDGDLGTDEVADAVAYAVAALEIVDSRIDKWDISFSDTVADNGSSGLYVLGEEQVSLDVFVPVHCEMRMLVDGVEASAGTGRACLGDPLAALSWLAQISCDVGQPLRAGEVILSGALGPMVPAAAGMEAVAEITGLGAVSCRFGERISAAT